MEKLKAAVIGLGRIGSTFDDEILRGGTFFLPYCHGPAYAESQLVDLIAGADPSEHQRSWFAERWGLQKTHLYSDYQDMLAKEKPDIVSVCTSARHRSIIIKNAAKAGVRGVWAEKPMTVTLAEADSLLKACQKYGTILLINCHRRWNPYFKELKGMIKAGDFGKIHQITVYGTFNLSSMGSHLIDTMNFLSDSKVEWVFGEMESDQQASKDNDLKGVGYLAYANGTRGFIRTMSSGASLTSIDVIGEHARAYTNDDGLSWHLLQSLDSNPRKPSMRPLSTRNFEPLAVEYPFPLPPQVKASGLAIVEDLVTCIKNRQKPECSGEDGRAALEIAMAMRQSHRNGGKRVVLPLADRELRMISSDTYKDAIPARLRNK